MDWIPKQTCNGRSRHAREWCRLRFASAACTGRERKGGALVHRDAERGETFVLPYDRAPEQAGIKGHGARDVIYVENRFSDVSDLWHMDGVVDLRRYESIDRGWRSWRSRPAPAGAQLNPFSRSAYQKGRRVDPRDWYSDDGFESFGEFNQAHVRAALDDGVE
jgi:hypothetical protein